MSRARFSLPAGGLEAGETIQAAAEREVAEEIGVRIDRPTDAHMLHAITGGSAWTSHFFIATDWTGEPRLRDAMPKPMVPYAGQALLCTRNGQPYSEYGWNQGLAACAKPGGAVHSDVI